MVIESSNGSLTPLTDKITFTLIASPPECDEMTALLTVLLSH